jgi:hypothetical protein
MRATLGTAVREMYKDADIHKYLSGLYPQVVDPRGKYRLRLLGLVR